MSLFITNTKFRKFKLPSERKYVINFYFVSIRKTKIGSYQKYKLAKQQKK